MTAIDDTSHIATGHVAAVITHRNSRVLALQRTGQVRWLLPGGPIAAHDDLASELSCFVRAMTGFEVQQQRTVHIDPSRGHTTWYVRCVITGVGSDITEATRTMRWLDPVAIVALMDAGDARGMRAGLSAGEPQLEPSDAVLPGASTLGEPGQRRHEMLAS